jgi:hypothetical protein
LEDLLKSEEKEYGRKIAKAQKVSLSSFASLGELLVKERRLIVARDPTP